MSRIIALALLLFVLATPAHAAIALVASTNRCDAGDGTNATSTAVNTTTATLVVVLGVASSSGTMVVSDNKTNTWSTLTPTEVGGGEMAQLFFMTAGTVGAGHTFTITASNGFSSVCVAAFSGTTGSSLLDLEAAGGTAFGTTVQPGSITPSANNYLHVTGVAFNVAGTMTISASHTIAAQVDVGAFTRGGALAYDIQTTATARNPTWTNTNTSSMAAVAASLKDVAGGGGGGTVPRGTLLGVGP